MKNIDLIYDYPNSSQDADRIEVYFQFREIGVIWEHHKGYCEVIKMPYSENHWNSTPDKQKAIEWLVKMANQNK